MKIISFVSTKGGVSKSVSAIMTAFILRNWFKVLLIDLDANNSVTSHFIANINQIEGRTIRQLLKGENIIDECIHFISGNLYLLPSEVELALIEEELYDTPNKKFLLYNLLNEIADDYDFCVIDTPPSLMSLASENAIITSDIITIPTQLEKWSARAINTTLLEINSCKKEQQLINKTIKKIQILPTQYVENRLVKKGFLTFLQKTFPDYISDVVIHSSSAVSQTFAMNNNCLTRNTRAYKEYKQFVINLIDEENIAKEVIFNDEEI